MTAESRIDAPMVRHRLIVSNADDNVLIDGGRLPQLVTDDRHTAEVDYINELAAQRLGLRAIVLRSLDHSDVVDGIVDRVHELELVDVVPSSATVRWRPANVEDLNDPADKAALALWLQQRHEPVVDGRDWMRRGWFAEACAWIERALHGAGLAAPLEVVQLRTWATSSVLLRSLRGRRALLQSAADERSGGGGHRAISDAALSRRAPTHRRRRAGPSVAADGCVPRPEARRHRRRRDMGARCGAIRPFAGRLYRPCRRAEGARLSVARSGTAGAIDRSACCRRGATTACRTD